MSLANEQTKVDVMRLTSEISAPEAVAIINNLGLASDNEQARVQADASIRVPIDRGLMTYRRHIGEDLSQIQVVKVFAGAYIVPKIVLGIFNAYRRRVDYFGRNYTESTDPTTGQTRIVLGPGVQTEGPTLDSQIFYLRVLGELYLPEGSVEVPEEDEQIPTLTSNTDLLITAGKEDGLSKLPPLIGILAKTVSVIY